MTNEQLCDRLFAHQSDAKIKVCVTIHSADMKQNYVVFADIDDVVELESDSGEAWISATCKSEHNNLFDEVKCEPAQPIVQVCYDEDHDDATT